LNYSERMARFAVSMLVILVAMQSSIAGTTMFGVVVLLAIGLATTAIIGWDPAKSIVFGREETASQHHHGHYA